MICYQNAFTGKAASCLAGGCAGVNRFDNVARGYVTVDVVTGCTTQLPATPGYFSGVASTQNALWGDYFYTNGGASLAEGEPLVHIEASTTDPETTIPGEYTFYGKYVGWTAGDNRESLATNFGVRYLNGNGNTSDVVVWRDSKVQGNTFVCPSLGGAYPGWYPLGQESFRIFDENGTITSNLINLGAVAQRTVVGGPFLPVPFPFGWFFFNLNTSVPLAGPVPPEDPGAAQAWITLISRQNPTKISVGYRALTYDSACDAKNVPIP